jgi:hypothetical protein
MWATWDFDSELQGPSLWGCFFENCFTEAGERRSEFPSRSTGLTALPSAFAYLTWSAFSASSFGFSG